MTRKKKPRLRRTPAQLDPGLQLAVKAAGGTMAMLAEALGITPQAISQWDAVPLNRLLDVEDATGIKRHRLRPDMYPSRRRT